MKFINSLLANWKTTISGIAAIATALSDGFQMSDMAALILGAGLISGKDADKTNAVTNVSVSKPTH